MNYLTAFIIGVLSVGAWLPAPQDLPINKDLHVPTFVIPTRNNNDPFVNFYFRRNNGFVMRLIQNGKTKTIVFTPDGRIKTQDFDVSDLETASFINVLENVSHTINSWDIFYSGCEPVKKAEAARRGDR